MTDAPGLRLRLPRACRMRSGKDFSRVYRSGVRVRGRLILVVAAPRPEGGPPRLGLSVGRKFSKKAVIRNRCRRTLREAFRLARPALPDFDLVLIPLARGERYRTGPCREELVELAARAARKWQKREERERRP